MERGKTELLSITSIHPLQGIQDFPRFPRSASHVSHAMATKYQTRISGPLLDRIDIRIEAPRVDCEKVNVNHVGESSESTRARVQVARDVQRGYAGGGDTTMLLVAGLL